jgi:hypothetical protein
MELILIMALFEYMEISWQRGNTLKELLIYNNEVYNKSGLLYFFRHIGFIYILAIIFILNLINIFTISILIMKSLDILFKLKIISRVSIDGTKYIDNLIGPVDFKINNTIRYANVVIYPLMLFFALI